MKSGTDWESGIAYTFLMIVICIFLFLGLVLVFIMQPLTNGFISSFNYYVGLGWITPRTAAAFNWNLVWIASLGTITLGLTLYYAIVKALEERVMGA